MSDGPAPRIALVDYGMGNRRSVHKALEHVGATVTVTGDPEVIATADGVVIPGVGAFPAAMDRIHGLGLADPLCALGRAGRPLLGICLGMQLLLDGSAELGETAGLGLIPGEVRRLKAGALRIPHIGWSEVTVARRAPLTDAIESGTAAFYHVHSYVAHPRDREDVLATATYGETFATVIGRGRVMGTQFHPEKSSAAGLALLSAFCELAVTASEPAR